MLAGVGLSAALQVLPHLPDVCVGLILVLGFTLVLLVVVGLESPVPPHYEHRLRFLELCVSEAHLRCAGLDLILLLVVVLDLLEHDVLSLFDFHLIFELSLLLAEITDALLVLDTDWPLRYHVLQLPDL